MQNLNTSPWGRPQQQKEIARGIIWVSTASHGGYWISTERRDAMPQQWRGFKTWAGGNWFEEDCDAAVVAVSFPNAFSRERVTDAQSFIDGYGDYFKERLAA